MDASGAYVCVKKTDSDSFISIANKNVFSTEKLGDAKED